MQRGTAEHMQQLKRGFVFQHVLWGKKIEISELCDGHCLWNMLVQTLKLHVFN